jgi:hypothetical protein
VNVLIPSPCPLPDPSPCQGEGKRAWRARVRVIVSRARRAHVACAIPRGVRIIVREGISNHFRSDLTAARFSLSSRAVRSRRRASITNGAVERSAERSAPRSGRGLKR